MKMKKNTDAEQTGGSSIDWAFQLKTKYVVEPSSQLFDVMAIHPSGAADQAQVGYYPKTDEIFIGGFENLLGCKDELFGEEASSGAYRQLFDDLKAWLRAEVLSADKTD